jgi:hypothetical protein
VRTSNPAIQFTDNITVASHWVRHFLPKRTQTFGDCPEGWGRQADTLKKPRVAVPSCCVMSMSSTTLNTLSRASFFIQNYSQPEEGNSTFGSFWASCAKNSIRALLYSAVAVTFYANLKWCYIKHNVTRRPIAKQRFDTHVPKNTRPTIQERCFLWSVLRSFLCSAH